MSGEALRNFGIVPIPPDPALTRPHDEFARQPEWGDAVCPVPATEAQLGTVERADFVDAGKVLDLADGVAPKTWVCLIRASRLVTDPATVVRTRSQSGRGWLAARARQMPYRLEFSTVPAPDDPKRYDPAKYGGLGVSGLQQMIGAVDECAKETNESNAFRLVAPKGLAAVGLAICRLVVHRAGQKSPGSSIIRPTIS